MPRSVVLPWVWMVLAPATSLSQGAPSATYDMQDWATSGGSILAHGDGYEVEIAVNQPLQGRAESTRFIFFAGVVTPTDLLFSDDFE